MSGLSRIDELLDADATNAKVVQELIRRLHPSASDLLDSAAGMFPTFGRVIGASTPFDQDDPELLRVADELGVTADELVRRLESSEQSPQLTRARTCWTEARAHTARVMVLLACHRQFMWGVTDMLRGRVTSALGYLRQEAESTALLHLFHDRLVTALEWRIISTDAEGAAFHKKYQRLLKAKMTELHLAFAYEHGSGSALHVRFAALARGLHWINPGHNQEGTSGAMALSFLEVDPKTPFRFYLSLLHFLHTQAKVFAALTLAFPNAHDAIWDQRVRMFNEQVEGLRTHIRNTYPVEVRSIEAAEESQ